jgi:signal transduction histidine kinase
MTAQVKRQAEQLAAKARIDGVLLATRTFEHELNTKLSSTIGYTQLILKDPALPEHLRKRAVRALEGAREAAAIIRRLIEITDMRVIDWADTGHTTIDVSPPRRQASQANAGKKSPARRKSVENAAKRRRSNTTNKQRSKEATNGE